MHFIIHKSLLSNENDDYCMIFSFDAVDSDGEICSDKFSTLITVENDHIQRLGPALYPKSCPIVVFSNIMLQEITVTLYGNANPDKDLLCKRLRKNIDHILRLYGPRIKDEIRFYYDGTNETPYRIISYTIDASEELINETTLKIVNDIQLISL